MPVVVVVDSEDLIALHVRGGSDIVSSTSRGIPEREGWPRQERLLASVETGTWNLEQKPQVLPLLLLAIPGEWWGVTIAWLPDGDVFGWKIDAQEPVRRVDDGYRSMDLMLDAIVEADFASWRIKDADELVVCLRSTAGGSDPALALVSKVRTTRAKSATDH
jgi:hypothetical protein